MIDNSVDKRISRTEAAFKKALIELLQTKEFAAISISDLTKKSGYSRSAFYQRFETKDEFLRKVVDDEVRRYLNVSVEAIQNGKVTSESISALFSHVYSYKDFYSLIFKGNNSNHMLTEEYFVSTAHKLFMSMGKLKTNNDNEEFDLDLFIYVSIREYLSYIKYWVLTDFKYSAEYIAKQFGFTERRCSFIKL